jgi:hypothetical protein
MKKRIVTLILACAVLLGACGLPMRSIEVRGSGTTITESRSVAGFSGVELSGIGTLFIEQGDVESLEITAEDNIMTHLKSRVSGSQLQLGVEELVNIHPTKDIIYRLKVKNLNQIGVSGLGNIESKEITSQNLTIQISGGGRISIDNLQATSLNLDISGMGDISANGSAVQQNIDISGAGNYNAPNLASQTAHVIISGSGNAVIWVSEKIDLDLSGAGVLHYYGSPTLNSNISGLGVVKNLGNK